MTQSSFADVDRFEGQPRQELATCSRCGSTFDLDRVERWYWDAKGRGFCERCAPQCSYCDEYMPDEVRECGNDECPFYRVPVVVVLGACVAVSDECECCGALRPLADPCPEGSGLFCGPCRYLKPDDAFAELVERVGGLLEERW